MLAIGLDVHQKSTVVATLDVETGVVSRRHVVQHGARLRNQIRALIRHEGQQCLVSNLVGKRAGGPQRPGGHALPR